VTWAQDDYRLARGIRLNSAQQILLGYVVIALVGSVMLALFDKGDHPFLDHLFTSASAVSTTGLTTIDIEASYSFAGHFVILLLIQVGGIGYMTIAALLVSSARHGAEDDPAEAEKADFALPPKANVRQFAKAACLMTLLVEGLGAAALFLAFRSQGFEDALWLAVFHSVSAFCTSGLALFPDSLGAFSGRPDVLLPISAVSLLGAIGFLVAWDLWRSVRARKLRVLFTNKVVIAVFTSILLLSTVALFLLDTRLRELDPQARLLNAFFAAMTSSTTAGFSTLPTPMLQSAALIIVVATMVIGASPSGTSGGIKTTTISVLAATTLSSLRQKQVTTLFGRSVSRRKIRAACSTLFFYLTLAVAATFVLLLTDRDAGLREAGFEVLSALCTVGLSFGLTGQLTDAGKAVVIVLMLAGRVGLLAFGAALASGGEAEEEIRDAEKVE